MGRKQLVEIFCLAASAVFVIVANGRCQPFGPPTPSTFISGSTCKNGAGSTSIVCTVPNANAGDLLLADIVTHCPIAGYPARIIPHDGWMLERMDVSGCGRTADTEQAVFWRNADAADFSPLPRHYTFSFSQESCSGKRCSTVQPKITAIGAIVAYRNTRAPRPLGFHDAYIHSIASATLNAPSVYSDANHSILVCFFGYVLANADSGTTPNPTGMSQRAVADNGVEHIGISDLVLKRTGWTKATSAQIPNSLSGTSVGTSIIIDPTDQAQLPAGDVSLADSPTPPSTAGAVYYVDSKQVGYNGTSAATEACTISDKGPGTNSTSPWCTIHRVNIVNLHPGDQVLFKAGATWRENLNPQNSGTPGARIVFGAYGTGPKPIIAGADIIAGWTDCTPAACGADSTKIWYKDVSYHYIEGIYVTSSNSCPGPACPAFNNDPGWGLARAGDLPAGSGTVPGPRVNPNSHGGFCGRGTALLPKMQPGTWLFDPTGTAGTPPDVTLGRVYVWMGDSSAPNSATIEAAVRDPIVGADVYSAASESYLTFINLHLTHGGEPLRFGRTYQDGGPANSPLNDRYITVEYLTADHLGNGQVDDYCYTGGIDIREGSNAVVRHVTESYVGGHGNNPKFHAVPFSIVEESDLNHDDYDAPDLKSCDMAVVRFNLSHDSFLAPTEYRSPKYYDGIYMESNYDNNLGSWTDVDLTAMSTRPYAALGWQIYGNTIWNITARTRGVYLHTWGMGAGQAFNNTIWGGGHSAAYAISMDNSKGAGSITNNLVHSLNDSRGISTGGYGEKYNLIGFTSIGSPIANNQAMSRTDTTDTEPLLADPPRDFTIRAGSRALNAGSQDEGFASFVGAWPQGASGTPSRFPRIAGSGGARPKP